MQGDARGARITGSPTESVAAVRDRRQSKGLRAAIRHAFGRRVLVQRCQVHKLRNVLGHLPETRHAEVRAAMRAAYKCTNAETAKRLLNNLARVLQKKHWRRCCLSSPLRYRVAQH